MSSRPNWTRYGSAELCSAANSEYQRHAGTVQCQRLPRAGLRRGNDVSAGRQSAGLLTFHLHGCCNWPAIEAYFFYMRRSVPSIAPLLWVIAFAFLAVRMTEVHWHLCFDGQEPRSSVHIGESADDHHAPMGDAGEHVDTDVSLTGQMLTKVGKIDTDDLPLFLLGALLLCAFLARPSLLLPISRRPALVAAPPAFLRPPLRGPPR